MYSFDRGDVVLVKGVFTNEETGNPVEPSTIKFRVKSPLGITTIYTYGVDSNITHPDPGTYVIRLEPDTQGVWMTKLEGTGANKSASKGKFLIEEDEFD